MKLFEINPKQGTVFVTVILIIILGSGYFLWYLPTNQHDIEKKRFRALQNVASNVDDKIGNSLSLLNTLMNDYDTTRANYTPVKVAQYIKDYTTKNFKLDITENYKPVKDATESKPPAGKVSDTTITFNADVLSIRLQRKSTMIEITYTFKQFIAGLLPEDIFDEYIIFNQPAVIYQTFQSGITKITADSLKSDKSAFKNGQVRDVSLSGTDYKLFSQQLNIKAKGEFTVAGLLTKTHYHTERNSLPNPAVLFLSMISIASIIALPWIKLYQMGSQDRMTAVDGIFSLAVPMLLMSILFFAFLYYSRPMQIGPYSFKEAAKKMSDRIKFSVSKEIRTTHKILNDADTIINPVNPVNELHTGFSIAIQKQLSSLSKRINVNQINTLDNNGKEIQNWSPQLPDAAPPGDYSNRNYFKTLKSDNPLYLGENYEQPYSLEPVISRTTGDFTTVMCIRSQVNKNTFTSLSFNLRALEYPILTPGFLYCIIDQNGKVLYHTKRAKQLNENLLEEFTEHETLAASLRNRTDTIFMTRYAGGQYEIFASPFADLPFSLLIMEDSSFINVRQVNNFVFTFSMLFSYFIVLGIELLILFAVSVRPAYYKKYYFDVSWIGPNGKFTKDYNLSFWGNIFIILILLEFWKTQPPFLEFLFIFLASAKLSYIFQNFLYALRYKSEDHSKFKFKIKSVWTMLGLLVLMNIYALQITSCTRLFIFEAIIVTVLYSLWKLYKDSGLQKILDWTGEKKFSTSFSLMTFTRLIITSGLPVALFFITIYNYNLRLVSRYRHTDFTNSVLAKARTQTDLNKLPIYADGVWINKYSFLDKGIGIAQPVPSETATNHLFSNLIINNQKLVPGINGISIDPQDGSRRFTNIFKTGQDSSDYLLPDKKHFIVNSLPLRYDLPLHSDKPDWVKDIFTWLAFLGALVGFFYAFNQIVKRLFGLNLPSNAGWPVIDQLLLQNNELNNLIFLIGVPGSGKLENVISLVKSGIIKGKEDTDLVYIPGDIEKNTCFIADMFLIPNESTNSTAQQDWEDMRKKALSSESRLVIVNQFEYDIKNPESNRIKLSLLEDILQTKNCKIIIISTVHPVNFLDSVNQQVPKSQSDTSPSPSPEHELERWHVLLGHFRIVIKKLDIQNKDFNLTGTWRDTLVYETQRGHLLREMLNPIIKRFDRLSKEGMNNDSITLKLGITAHYFYMYIWQSLTKEEKFILYDLAEDGLVNPFDEYNLMLLISKGLVVREEDCILRLFNQGFRNFILTAIGKSEADIIQKQIKDNGNWSKLKTPITLLIAVVLIFLFASQKETYSDLIKYLAVITGGVPLLLQVFNMFKPDGSKPK